MPLGPCTPTSKRNSRSSRRIEQRPCRVFENASTQPRSMTSWPISYRWRERDENAAGDFLRALVRARTVRTVDLRPCAPDGAGARQLADLSRDLRRTTILRARRDQPRERAAAA